MSNQLPVNAPFPPPYSDGALSLSHSSSSLCSGCQALQLQLANCHGAMEEKDRQMGQQFERQSSLYQAQLSKLEDQLMSLGRTQLQLELAHERLGKLESDLQVSNSRVVTLQETVAKKEAELRESELSKLQMLETVRRWMEART